MRKEKAVTERADVRANGGHEKTDMRTVQGQTLGREKEVRRVGAGEKYRLKGGLARGVRCASDNKHNVWIYSQMHTVCQLTFPYISKRAKHPSPN